MALLDTIRKFYARLTTSDIGTSKDRILWIGNQVAGVRMTPEEALKLSAVWACVSVISKSLASSVWDVFTEEPNGNRDLRRQSNTYRLLNIRPNAEMTSFAFREAMAVMALVWGNAIAEIERDIVGRPAALWPIAPDRFQFERDGDGNLVVRVYNFSGGDAILPYRDVFHIHGPGCDGINGFEIGTPSGVAARSMAHAAAAEIYGGAFYGNGATFGGVLKSDTALSDEQQKTIQDQLDKQHVGPDKAFKWVFFGGGIEPVKQSITPEEGQFIETRQHLIEEIARWFGVPPHKIQDMRRSTFNNIEHQGLEFVNDALTPWAERFAQEANWKVVPVQFRGRMKTRFELDWLAEGDAKSKAEVDRADIISGKITINEARRRRGLNTIGPDGDVHVMQSAMTTLDKILNPPEPEPPQLPPPDESDEDMEETAQAMFASTFRRCLTRLETRALDNAKSAKSSTDFAKRMAGYKPHYAKMVGEQLRDGLDAMQLLGVSANRQGRFKTVLMDAVTEDIRLLVNAQANGGVDGWCDIGARAESVAARLAAELTR